MANQRKKGVERVTLTIPEEMLTRLEQQAEEQGIDRLALMREALRTYLTAGGSGGGGSTRAGAPASASTAKAAPATPRPASSSRGAKSRPPRPT